MRKPEKKEKFYKKSRRKFRKQKELRNRAAEQAFFSKFEASLRSKKQIPLLSHSIRCASIFDLQLVFFFLYVFFPIRLLLITKKKNLSTKLLRAVPRGFETLLIPGPTSLFITSKLYLNADYREYLNSISSSKKKSSLIIKKAIFFDRSFSNSELMLDFREILSFMFHTKRKQIYKFEKFILKPFKKFIKFGGLNKKAERIKNVLVFLDNQKKIKYLKNRRWFLFKTLKKNFRRFRRFLFYKRFIKFVYDFTKYRYRFGFNFFLLLGRKKKSFRRKFTLLNYVNYFQKFGRRKKRRFVLFPKYLSKLKRKLHRNIQKKEAKNVISFFPRKDRNLTFSNKLDFFPLRVINLFAEHKFFPQKPMNFKKIFNFLRPRYFLYRLVALEVGECNVYYLSFRKKRSNFYFTVFNSLGEVVYFISSGRFTKFTFKKRNRKLRSSLFSLNAIIRVIARVLKRKRIFKIHFFLIPTSLRFYMIKKIIYSFSNNGIKLMKLRNAMKHSHGNFFKNKKIRRL